MGTSEGVPEQWEHSGRGSGVGGHIHRLLALAAALTKGAEAQCPDLGVLTDDQAAAWGQTLEHLSRLLDGLQVQAAAELGTRVEVGRYRDSGAANPVEYLAQSLRLSGADASRRLALAGQLLPITDPISLHTAPACQPVLARAFFNGQCSAQTAWLVAKNVQAAAHIAAGGRIADEEVDAIEESLAGLVGVEGPAVISRCAARALNHLDPDGQVPTEAELLAKEGIHFHQPRRGMVHFEGHLTTVAYEEVMATIGTGTNPRNTKSIGNTANSLDGPAALVPDWAFPGNGNMESGASVMAAGTDNNASSDVCTGAGTDTCTETPGSVGTGRLAGGQEESLAVGSRCGEDWNPADPVLRDPRPRPQRLLHTLLDCVRLASRTNTLPDNGGLRPQLFVTMSLADLQEGTGSALLPHAGPVPIGMVLQAACDANIIPAVLGTEGEILDIGRSQRLVSPEIRKALLIRDQGCAFPGCDRPPQWTEAHHIVYWSQGGDTSVQNCVLLCTYHHHLIHHTDWTVTMDHGIPWFIPPATLDIHQRPRRNHHHNPPPLE